MTQWTREQYDKLTKDFFYKFDIIVDAENPYSWVKIMELCVKHGVEIVYDDGLINAYYHPKSRFPISQVLVSDQNNDPSLAERIARMLALMEM